MTGTLTPHCITHRGLNHVGLTVRDMRETLQWYRDVFGVQERFIQQAGAGPELDAATGLDEAALTYAFVELGNTCIEFLEYQHPPGEDHDRRNCDVGTVHVCFEVEDANEAYEKLLQMGVATNAPPVFIGEGPIKGWTFCYFRDPNGIQLEVISAPRT